MLDRQRRPALPMTLALPSLNRHTFVCGATGAGKSQTVRSLLEQATAAGIPWLVVEPAKAEYRRMAVAERGYDRLGKGGNEWAISEALGQLTGRRAGVITLDATPGAEAKTEATLRDLLDHGKPVIRRNNSECRSTQQVAEQALRCPRV
ncbi:helicase HerA-like domain-containing protein [Actinopolymorpha alba]|uniref:helicase HerA-like domain-containing protein n=1 Tax=Actinopolymorpha alba TaxID=533267 RepID=UPI00037D8A20|nr:helicase HerA-like domain-containing protein [Actinopolymorpha alba]